MRAAVDAVVSSPAFAGVMVFLGLYPLVSALAWMGASVAFAARRETHAEDAFYELDTPLAVSVLIPAHNEEAVVADTVESALGLD